MFLLTYPMLIFLLTKNKPFLAEDFYLNLVKKCFRKDIVCI